MSTPRELYTVSRVLEMTGLAPEVLDRLEDEVGDHLQVRRTSGGNRLFTPGDVAHLKEMKRLIQDEGRNLDEVCDLLFEGTPEDPVDTLPGGVSRSAMEATNGTFPDGTGGRRQVDVRRPDGSTVSVPVRTCERSEERMVSNHDATAADDATPLDTAAGFPDPVDTRPAGGDGDLDPASISVPALPVEPTVDLLLEATEGLVQENLKLRKAIDGLAERCTDLEDRMQEMDSRRGLFAFLRRS